MFLHFQLTCHVTGSLQSFWTEGQCLDQWLFAEDDAILLKADLSSWKMGLLAWFWLDLCSFGDVVFYLVEVFIYYIWYSVLICYNRVWLFGLLSWNEVFGYRVFLVLYHLEDLEHVYSWAESYRFKVLGDLH